eukprot:jgi/Mesvir1/25088/Mv21555-RA.1
MNRGVVARQKRRAWATGWQLAKETIQHGLPAAAKEVPRTADLLSRQTGASATALCAFANGPPAWTTTNCNVRHSHTTAGNPVSNAHGAAPAPAESASTRTRIPSAAWPPEPDASAAERIARDVDAATPDTAATADVSSPVVMLRHVQPPWKRGRLPRKMRAARAKEGVRMDTPSLPLSQHHDTTLMTDRHVPAVRALDHRVAKDGGPPAVDLAGAQDRVGVRIQNGTEVGIREVAETGATWGGHAAVVPSGSGAARGGSGEGRERMLVSREEVVAAGGHRDISTDDIGVAPGSWSASSHGGDTVSRQAGAAGASRDHHRPTSSIGPSPAARVPSADSFGAHSPGMYYNHNLYSDLRLGFTGHIGVAASPSTSVTSATAATTLGPVTLTLPSAPHQRMLEFLMSHARYGVLPPGWGVRQSNYVLEGAVGNPRLDAWFWGGRHAPAHRTGQPPLAASLEFKRKDMEMEMAALCSTETGVLSDAKSGSTAAFPPPGRALEPIPLDPMRPVHGTSLHGTCAPVPLDPASLRWLFRLLASHGVTDARSNDLVAYGLARAGHAAAAVPWILECLPPPSTAPISPIATAFTSTQRASARPIANTLASNGAAAAAAAVDAGAAGVPTPTVGYPSGPPALHPGIPTVPPSTPHEKSRGRWVPGASTSWAVLRACCERGDVGSSVGALVALAQRELEGIMQRGVEHVAHWELEADAHRVVDGMAECGMDKGLQRELSGSVQREGDGVAEHSSDESLQQRLAALANEGGVPARGESVCSDRDSYTQAPAQMRERLETHVQAPAEANTEAGSPVQAHAQVQAQTQAPAQAEIQSQAEALAQVRGYRVRQHLRRSRLMRGVTATLDTCGSREDVVAMASFMATTAGAPLGHLEEHSPSCVLALAFAENDHIYNAMAAAFCRVGLDTPSSLGPSSTGASEPAGGPSPSERPSRSEGPSPAVKAEAEGLLESSRVSGYGGPASAGAGGARVQGGNEGVGADPGGYVGAAGSISGQLRESSGAGERAGYPLTSLLQDCLSRWDVASASRGGGGLAQGSLRVARGLLGGELPSWVSSAAGESRQASVQLVEGARMGPRQTDQLAGDGSVASMQCQVLQGLREGDRIPQAKGPDGGWSEEAQAGADASGGLSLAEPSETARPGLREEPIETLPYEATPQAARGRETPQGARGRESGVSEDTAPAVFPPPSSGISVHLLPQLFCSAYVTACARMTTEHAAEVIAGPPPRRQYPLTQSPHRQHVAMSAALQTMDLAVARGIPLDADAADALLVLCGAQGGGGSMAAQRVLDALIRQAGQFGRVGDLGWVGLTRADFDWHRPHVSPGSLPSATVEQGRYRDGSGGGKHESDPFEGTRVKGAVEDGRVTAKSAAAVTVGVDGPRPASMPGDHSHAGAGGSSQSTPPLAASEASFMASPVMPGKHSTAAMLAAGDQARLSVERGGGQAPSDLPWPPAVSYRWDGVLGRWRGKSGSGWVAVDPHSRLGRPPLRAPLFNTLMSLRRREGRLTLPHASGVVAQMDAVGVAPDAVTFNTALGMCEKMEDVRAVVRGMVERQIRPSTATFNAMLAHLSHPSDMPRATATPSYPLSTRGQEHGLPRQGVPDWHAAFLAPRRITDHPCRASALGPPAAAGGGSGAAAFASSLTSLRASSVAAGVAEASSHGPVPPSGKQYGQVSPRLRQTARLLDTLLQGTRAGKVQGHSTSGDGRLPGHGTSGSVQGPAASGKGLGHSGEERPATAAHGAHAASSGSYSPSDSPHLLTMGQHSSDVWSPWSSPPLMATSSARRRATRAVLADMRAAAVLPNAVTGTLLAGFCRDAGDAWLLRQLLAGVGLGLGLEAGAELLGGMGGADAPAGTRHAGENPGSCISVTPRKGQTATLQTSPAHVSSLVTVPILQQQEGWEWESRNGVGWKEGSGGGNGAVGLSPDDMSAISRQQGHSWRPRDPTAQLQGRRGHLYDAGEALPGRGQMLLLSSLDAQACAAMVAACGRLGMMAEAEAGHREQERNDASSRAGGGGGDGRAGDAREGITIPSGGVLNVPRTQDGRGSHDPSFPSSANGGGKTQRHATMMPQPLMPPLSAAPSLASRHPWPTPTLEVYNALLSGYLHAGDLRAGLAVLRRLRAAGITPDLVTFNSIAVINGRAAKRAARGKGRGGSNRPRQPGMMATAAYGPQSLAQQPTGAKAADAPALSFTGDGGVKRTGGATPTLGHACDEPETAHSRMPGGTVGSYDRSTGTTHDASGRSQQAWLWGVDQTDDDDDKGEEEKDVGGMGSRPGVAFGYELLDMMEAAGVAPDGSTFVALLAAHAAERDSQGALQLLQWMRRRGLRADVAAYNTLLGTFGVRPGVGMEMGRGGGGGVEMGRDEETGRYGSSSGHDGSHHGGSSSSSSSSSSYPRFASRLSANSSSLESSHVPSSSSLSSSSSSPAYLVAARAELGKCLTVLDLMGVDGVSPDRITFNTLLSRCADAGEAELAERLIGEMWARSGTSEADARSHVARARAAVAVGAQTRARARGSVLAQATTRGGVMGQAMARGGVEGAQVERGSAAERMGDFETQVPQGDQSSPGLSLATASGVGPAVGSGSRHDAEAQSHGNGHGRGRSPHASDGAGGSAGLRGDGSQAVGGSNASGGAPSRSWPMASPSPGMATHGERGQKPTLPAPVPDRFSFRALMAAYRVAGRPEQALVVAQRMDALDLAKDTVTCNELLRCCRRVGDVAAAEAVMDQMRRAAGFGDGSGGSIRPRSAFSAHGDGVHGIGDQGIGNAPWPEGGYNRRGDASSSASGGDDGYVPRLPSRAPWGEREDGEVAAGGGSGRGRMLDTGRLDEELIVAVGDAAADVEANSGNGRMGSHVDSVIRKVHESGFRYSPRSRKSGKQGSEDDDDYDDEDDDGHHTSHYSGRASAGPDHSSYHLMMTIYCHVARWDDALALLVEMSARGLHPGSVAYNILALYAARMGQTELSLQVVEQAARVGVWLPPLTYEVLLRAFCGMDSSREHHARLRSHDNGDVSSVPMAWGGVRPEEGVREGHPIGALGADPQRQMSGDGPLRADRSLTSAGMDDAEHGSHQGDAWEQERGWSGSEYASEGTGEGAHLAGQLLQVMARAPGMTRLKPQLVRQLRALGVEDKDLMAIGGAL